MARPLWISRIEATTAIGAIVIACCGFAMSGCVLTGKHEKTTAALKTCEAARASLEKDNQRLERELADKLSGDRRASWPSCVASARPSRHSSRRSESSPRSSRR